MRDTALKVEILVNQNLRLTSDLHMLHCAHVHPHEHAQYKHVCVYTYIKTNCHPVRLTIELLSHIGHNSTAR